MLCFTIQSKNGEKTFIQRILKRKLDQIIKSPIFENKNSKLVNDSCFLLEFKANLEKTYINTQINSFATRQRLVLTVRFTLKNTKQKNSILSGTVRSFSSLDIGNQTFAYLVSDVNVQKKLANSLVLKLSSRILVFLHEKKKSNA